MFQYNSLLSKKNNSSNDSTGSILLPVSPAVNGLNKSVTLNKSWLPGFGDNHKKKFTSAVKKLTSLMMLSITIILISSFTLESGNKQNSNEALMTISDAPDWTVNFGYSFGSASSAAGDVNGDGYDDVIIGRKENTTNFTNDGKAYVFLGSTSGLATSPVWSDIGANQGSAYGHSLANAGDVNGDGYDDIIIGEPGYKVGNNSKGRALVYYGSSTGPSATPSWIYIGTTTDFGRSVATAGDVNGDGYDDVIVGSAYGGLDSASNKGAVLVFYGSASGLSATPDWQKEGTQSFGQFGHSVRTSGDVNNDGYSDIIVGAPVNSGAAGQAFVFPGSASGLSNTPVWTGTGEFSNQRFGYSVHNAGDVNSDGYDDIVVGAPDDNAGGTGKAYVYYGNSSGVSASAVWTAVGTANSNFGQWAATAGDYNGDGFSDLIVGAPGNSPYGKAFVYKGSSAGLSANSVWISEGDASTGTYGFTVGTAGDVNNDGYDDVLITPYSPKAFVFHGAADSGNVLVSGALSPNGTYQNLADAFAVINSTPQTGANITISIIGNTTEPPTGAILNNGAWNSVLIKPDGGEARNVTGNINNGLPLIDLNGADNVTIDGLNTGGNSLTISNPRSTASFENWSGTSTIRLRSDATYNLITRCTILGSAKGSFSSEIGNIIFSSNSSLTGNDFNVVSFCNLGPAGGIIPSRAIHFGGTTSSTNLNNSGDTIRNCNIYDFQDSLYNHAGIYIRQGSTDIVIKDNKLYQTQTRTMTTGAYITHHAVKIDNPSGNNFTISGNTIGYSSANGTGTYTLAFSDFLKSFIPIELSAGITAASNIQGNVIKSILISDYLSNDFFKGINVTGGSVNIGTESGNIIGDSVLTESILVNGFASSSCIMKGIYLAGNGTCITRNNKLSGIKLNMTNAASSRLYGIHSELSAYWECRNNFIGGPVALSINNTGTNQNTELNGIVNTGGAADISENLIRNLNTIGGTVYGSFAAPLAGIRSDGSGDQTISKNLIHSLTNTNPSLTGNAGAANVMGIYFSNNSGNNVIEKNFIHSIKVNSYIGSIHGMRIMSGTSEYINNMIRLGVDASGNGANNPCLIYGISDQGGVNSFYHNSIYIGGNPFAGGSGSTYGVYSTHTGSRNYINNCIFNARSNNGSGGTHSAIRIFDLSGFTSNYNILFANGSGGIVGYFNGQKSTIAIWRTSTGQDANSVSANPQYANPNGSLSNLDLHILNTFPTPVESYGTSIVSVTEDFDGELRSSLTPNDIGADAGNFLQLDPNPMIISYSLLSAANNTVSISFPNVTITDPDGVNTAAGTKPRVYFKRKSDANTFNDNTNATAGWKYSEATNSSSPFNFTMQFSNLSGGLPAPTDSIQYFVVAQDLAGLIHVAINSGTFNQYPVNAELSASAFPVTGSINSFTFTGLAVTVTGALAGNGSFPTLASAFTSINSGAQTGSNINISIFANTTEPVSGASLNQGAWNSLNITPSGSRTISAAVTGGTGLVRLNGADNVTVDGLNSGGNSLSFSNTTASSVSGTSTIFLTGDANNNKITNCTILGSSINTLGSSGGTVTFGGGISTGNDNNVISNCNIGPAGSNLPTKAVSFLGSSPASMYNNGDTIRNCNIFDYFSASGNSAGISILSGNTDISVLNNKFYQTSLRTQTSGTQHSAVWVDFTLGNDFKINGNTIGYSSSDETGEYSFAGVVNSRFFPIFLNSGNAVASSVQGNTIAGISMSGALSGTGISSPFIGIFCASGLGNIGNDSGNTIGNLSSVNSIAFTSSSGSNSDVAGIYTNGPSGINTSNNIIAGITAANSSTGASSIYPLRNNSTGNWTCANNIIGGAIANSIRTTTTSTSTILQGIFNTGRASVISGNIIRNMTSAGGTNPLAGIAISTGNYTHNISQNSVYALSNTNPSQATTVTGILFTSTGISNVIERNNIHSLSASAISSTINGIHIQSGTATYKNNMIRLGINSEGSGINTSLFINGIYETGGTNNIYFNSVYIGGNPVSNNSATFAFRSFVTSVTRNYINNILFNARSNSGGTAKHYAVSFAGTGPLPSGCMSDNNLLYANGSGGVLGFYNSAERTTLEAWKTATGLDINSISANPVFKNPTGNTDAVNLHIGNFPTPVEKAGVVIPSVTDDFDGELRSGLSPTDIGADAGNFTMTDINPMTISFTPLVNDSVQSTINFTGVTISDSDGVAVSGNLRPRVYFKKKNDVNAYSDNTNATAGWKFAASNGTTSPFDFTIDLTKINTAPSLNDTIQYFVVAQDMALTPHTFSNTVTFADYPSGAELTSAAFPVTGTPNFFRLIKNPLSGDYIVGLSLFNEISGRNITFEKRSVTVTKEVTVIKTDGINSSIENNVMEAEEEIFVPMENGKLYKGPLGIKRRDNPEIDAQAMSGVYANITEAINDLKTWGASGPVRFMLNDNAYTSETLPVSITPWTGASSVNTLTIKPNAGVTSEISGSNATALFDINNGDYFTIDGSNTEGGKTKDLTIRNTSNTALRFINDATNNIIKNTVLKSNNIVVFFYTTTGTTGNDNNIIHNNDITGSTLTCGYGVYNSGTGASSAHKNSGIQITGNRIYNFSVRGIQDNGNSAGIIYRSNEFFQTTPQSSSIPFHIASSTVEGFTFDKNNIYDMLVSASGTVYGIWIQNLAGASTGEITNNFITLYSSVQNNGIGIYDQSPVKLNIYHNTIVISGNVPGNQQSVGYYRVSNSTVNLKNNIIINTRTGSTAENYVIRNHGNLSLLNSDHNDLLNSGIGNNVFAFDGTGYRYNLNEWKTATGKDSNSISADPLFVSSSDLHIDSLQNSPVSNAGKFIAGVTQDIDGDLRDTLTPDIGADEFNIPSASGTLNLTMIMEGFYSASSNSMSMNDSVTVFLRNASSPYAIVDSAKGIIDANTFTGSFTISNVPSGSYFIQTAHRNTIETWSGSAVNYTTGATINYDFTASASQAFGNNIIQIDTSPLRFAIYSGDVNQDGVVDLADGSLIDNDAFNFAAGYLPTDVNGDEVTDLADAVFADNNGFNFVGVIRP